MTPGWRAHQEAHEELAAAVDWYEAQHAGSGDKLTDAVEYGITSILDPSTSWGFYRKRRRTPQIYSRSIVRFPMDIIYLRMNGEVYVVAFAHERRRPGYWEHRLES